MKDSTLQYKTVVLQHKTKDGELYKATFLPENGMTLCSFKKGDVEVIDQTTWHMFEEKCSGLGQYIGPHFYHRKPEEVTQVPDPSLFPHLNGSQGTPEPFSHGIGHFVPWNWGASDTTMAAYISGIDNVGGVTLAALEGFDFQLNYHVRLTATGLEIDLKADSDRHPVFCGLHTYYALTDSTGHVTMNCEGKYNDMGNWQEIPDRWKGTDRTLDFNLDEAADYGLHPVAENGVYKATLATGKHKVHVSYESSNPEEHGFQLYHPEGASFGCLEPGSARDFRAANQLNNHLKIKLEIE